ncbi:MAG: glucose-1-phosphate thymidylyltransferase, glucose-1-phosphate thymidylyltransferase [Candidatus Peregrinibacteria bacterium GW2011_GWC2_39_14]|nr:MAG: Glucose-1-phosphate thymidylyltransferase [Candidatus Peregrinibacteria bacterium GW2011_GWA2_38_36]KKR05155.1 MAG: glucose-1-phosphate thymidylyltransferase, glucose-1-phosphate thymidylyltransferase [Candidatus Peregrinibacteria bacterium GW2011_GWC2_39_14]
MKGIILAGGSGTRLSPLTKVTNKHLLAIYNKPMIFYPLQTLIDAGIKDIMIITGDEHAGSFLRLLGSGERFGCNFSYRVQEGSFGIAHALSLASDFVGNDNCAVILGDNVYEDNFEKDVKSFKTGSRIFLKEISDPQRFGVAELDGNRVINIEEKPKNPKTNYAVTGFYLYDKDVFKIIANLKPSARGEYEITDVNNNYIQKSLMHATILNGEWTDSGTFESLYKANTIARKISLEKESSLDCEHNPNALKKTSDQKIRSEAL